MNTPQTTVNPVVLLSLHDGVNMNAPMALSVEKVALRPPIVLPVMPTGLPPVNQKKSNLHPMIARSLIAFHGSNAIQFIVMVSSNFYVRHKRLRLGF